MKTVSTWILAWPAWLAILTAGVAWAQQGGVYRNGGLPGSADVEAVLPPGPLPETLPPVAPEGSGFAAPNAFGPAGLGNGLTNGSGNGLGNGLNAAERFGPPAPPCCEDCGSGSCCPPLWYITQGVRVLSRGKVRDQVISGELFLGQVKPELMLSTGLLGFEVSGGYILTIGRYLGRDKENRDDFLEFTYWGLNSWQESHEAAGHRITLGVPNTQTELAFGSLISGFSPTPPTYYDSPVGGFNRADLQTITYLSEIHSFELNLRINPRSRSDRLVYHPNGRWRRECQPGQYLSYFLGVRYLLLNESFRFRSDGVFEIFDNGQLVSARNNFGDYSIFAHNNLVGLQLGGDVTFRRCRANWGVRGKVGPYINFADQNSHCVTNAFGDPFATTELDWHRSRADHQISCVGELSFFGNYRLRPNFILHCSYDLNWITGLALAPDQLLLQTNPANTLVTDGSLFIQGLTLQAEMTW